jgi:hypothetical protein
VGAHDQPGRAAKPELQPVRTNSCLFDLEDFSSAVVGCGSAPSGTAGSAGLGIHGCWIVNLDCWVSRESRSMPPTGASRDSLSAIDWSPLNS